MAALKPITIVGGGLAGLTLGIGLRQRGVPVVDTDLLARDVVAPGQPALDEIQRVFGAGLIGTDGQLRRDALARRVFPDPAARKPLPVTANSPPLSSRLKNGSARPAALETLRNFFIASPLRDSNLQLERVRDSPRELDL